METKWLQPAQIFTPHGQKQTVHGPLAAGVNDKLLMEGIHAIKATPGIV